ncbi:uncharacterized protein Bfra_005447 [Botrytis fragariae]|uniref:Uncharacterized protein n=1 Tax=Botrytis fragariae TaxID=1964551 RepID=A0A8H6AV47_9HELO|nr:uncharacterized protein Bfra_005447 [Botrytis fragariae]KAF5873980.1 hypothetical protein Bfra_005447 [Botrytis fragariae]
MSTPVDSSHDAHQSKAEFYAQIVKDLRKEMHDIFICTKCRTKGNIVVVTDHTLPTGEPQTGDSWALMMIKQNTRYELHPSREAAGLSGNESAAQLRRILQSTLDENRDLKAERSSAVKVIEKLRRDHQKKTTLQVDNFQVSIKQIQDQIQSERQENSEQLRLADNRNKALHDKSVSLDSKYQKIMANLKEEQKKNLGLVSDLEKLSEEHQQLRLSHETLRETSERVKPLLRIGIALRLRWLENIHFMFEGHNGRILDGRIVESGNVAAHDPNFEADSLLAQHAGLSVESIDRVNESMQRIYGKRHVPTSADSLVLHTYPSALIFVLDCKTAAAIHQSRELLVDYPYHQKLRLILKEMMVIWERAESREKFESIARVEELQKEAVQIWEAVKIAFRNSKRRSRPPD